MSRSAALLMLAVLATVLGAACRRTTDVPKADAPSLNVTVPVGVPVAGATTATLAVNVTDWPKLAGLVSLPSAVAVGVRTVVCTRGPSSGSVWVDWIW